MTVTVVVRADRISLGAALGRLYDQLNAINWTYGKGDIQHVTIYDRKDFFAGKVLRRMQYGTDEKTFTIRGNKLKFLGKQRTIKLYE
jgi:hypothetical protein